MHAAADGLHPRLEPVSAPRRASGSPQRLVAQSFADRRCSSATRARKPTRARSSSRAAGRARMGDAKHEIIALRGAFHGRLFAHARGDRPSGVPRCRSARSPPGVVDRRARPRRARRRAERGHRGRAHRRAGAGRGRRARARRGFLRELRALTTARNIALIFDEIQCGLGRTGTLFAYEQVGVEPDMMTLAKPLAGGLPMGAVLMTQEIAATMQARRPRHDVRRRSVRRHRRATTCSSASPIPRCSRTCARPARGSASSSTRSRIARAAFARCAAWATCGAST